MTKFKINKSLNFIYAIAAFILILLLGSYFYSTSEVKLSEQQLQHTQDVMAKSNIILLNVLDIEAGTRGYYLTGDDVFLKPYPKAILTSVKSVKDLEVLTKNDNAQSKNVELLKEQVLKKTNSSKNLIKNTRNATANNITYTINLEEGKVVTDSIRSLIFKINETQVVSLKLQKIQRGATNKAADFLLGIIFLFIGVTIILLFYIFKNQQRTTAKLIAYNANQRASSKYSRSLIEASRDPLFTISTVGKITDANNAAVSITGVAKNDLIGSDFYNYFTDSDQAKQGYQIVFEKGFIVDFPLTIKNEFLTDVLFNGAVYKDENVITLGAVVVARDITEQKKVEQTLLEYKQLFDESLDFACIANYDGYFEIVNKTFITVLGYSEEHLLSNKFMTFVHPDDVESTKLSIKNLLVDNQSLNFVNRYIKKDGTAIILDWKSNYNPISNKVYAVARDITSQKALEKELTEAKTSAEMAKATAEEEKNNAHLAKEIAEEAVIAKQQFLSNMSHEIRTPMNAIIGFTKVLLKTNLTTEQKKYLVAVKMSGDSLILLLNDILDLAKVNAGKLTFDNSAFELSHTLENMLHLFETKIQEKNLQLHLNFDQNIPSVLKGDSVRLNQIILNLVSNAIKFTFKGEVSINVELLRQNENFARIKFTITDTGIGISADDISSIFDDFQQATKSTTRLYGGTGLGLAIVKQLVEAQGGSISVQSEVEKGSVFSFELEFEVTDEEVEHDPEILKLDSRVKNIKVLVVEDMELNQLLMKTLIDDFGFECDITANGKLAIEKLQAKAYDIVLMDLQMPEMNGFEATSYIRNEMKSDIPIIALTADVTSVDVQKCKEAGMNDYISKPVDERLLYSKLIAYYKKPVVIIEQTIEGKNTTEKVKYVDMSYLIKLTKADKTLMTQMINAYLEQTPPLLDEMKKSVNNKDWKALQAAVHKMIPSFSIIGLDSNILEVAKRIQEYAYSIEVSEEIKILIAELEDACTKSFEELQAELTTLN